MAVNFKALGWMNWFESGANPAWPDHMTKAAWDKKKGLIAKATPTGIGDQLVKTKAAFDAAVVRRPLLVKRNIDELAKQIPLGAKFITSSEVKKLHAELKKLRDVAEAAKNTYKRSKAPGLGGTIKLCELIATDADHMMVAVNPNSLSGILSTFEKEGTEQIHAMSRKLVGPTVENMRGVPAKVGAVLAGLKAKVEDLQKRDAKTRDQGGEVAEALDKELTALRSEVGSALARGARDMTQPVINLRKAQQAGVALTDCDPKVIEKLQALLVPYGNKDKGNSTDATYAQMLTKIADVEKGRKMFEPIAKDCQIA